MKVLLSIKPEFAEKILSGEKKYEFRKVLPKAQDIKIIVIYASQPTGKVVGEFEIAQIISDTPNKIWSRTKEGAGISRRYFDEYFAGKALAHAIQVRTVKRYARPRALGTVLPSGIAPQSFCYIKK
ncbi:ASCH domain-containing protein [Rugamonas sp. FT82W]|uniref:ASCH domain-containing protein n=2 Tax=Duganella vulcania TaxID=2692166 RepID=A0A845G508_9BURK|nr:ASCH domain-containing protein [Duganella vulcania]